MKDKVIKIIHDVDACPFCCGDDTMVAVGDGSTVFNSKNWYIECRGCMARGPVEDSFAAAVDAWGNEMGVIDEDSDGGFGDERDDY